jgi:hypothetical protein
MVKYLLTGMIFILLCGNSFSQNSFYFNTYSQKRKQFTDQALYFLTDSFHLVKSDYSGTVSWIKYLPDTWSWSACNDAIYILAGNEIASKLDTSGNIIWSRDISTLACVPLRNFTQIAANNDRLYFHWQYSTTHDALLVLDTAGAYINAWCDNSNLIDFQIVSLFPELKGNMWIHMVDGPGNGNYAILTKLDKNGNPATASPVHKFNICLDDYIEDVLSFSDSTYLIINNGNDFFSIFSSNFGIFKMDSIGNIFHHKVFDSLGDSAFQIVRACIDSIDNIYLIIKYLSDSAGYISLKLDSSLNVVDSKIWNPVSLPFSMTHYDRMKIYNGQIFIPVVYHYNASTFYQAILQTDTVLTPICWTTTSPVGVTEKPYTLNFSQWNTVGTFSHSPPAATQVFGPGTNTLVFNYCSSVSVANPGSGYELNVYPVPVEQSIYITIGSSINSLSIYNINGQQLMNFENLSSTQEIDLRNLQAGFYYLKFYHRGETVVKKILKL